MLLIIHKIAHVFAPLASTLLFFDWGALPTADSLLGTGVGAGAGLAAGVGTGDDAIMSGSAVLAAV